MNPAVAAVVLAVGVPALLWAVVWLLPPRGEDADRRRALARANRTSRRMRSRFPTRDDRWQRMAARGHDLDAEDRQRGGSVHP